MYYKVSGQLKTETAAEFRRLLLDGTIAAQEPDGEEIVDSMHRAVVSDTGDIEWSEVCYCTPPLRHERATVYDRFFSTLSTEPVDDYQEHHGRPFMQYLEELANKA